MIYQNTEIENTQNQFSNAFKELQLGKLLRKANITKNCGIPAYEIFHFLLLLVFQGRNLFRMVKQLKQRYIYRGQPYTLPELRKFVRFEGTRNIFGSLCVTTKKGIPVKIVFVRNRNKKSECLYLLSTDCSLSDTEIVRIYGKRWPIECFFKASKSFLKPGTEFQSRSYDAMVSYTTIVFTRYIILE